MTEPITISAVPFGSALYDAMKELRDAVLRRPLGLTLGPADLAGEEEQIHLAAIAAGAVVGTVLLKPMTGHTVKLRQMTVAPSQQGRGIGGDLVRSAEVAARVAGFTTIVLTARLSAHRFYDRLGYRRTGDEFLEIGLPHVTMTRRL